MKVLVCDFGLNIELAVKFSQSGYTAGLYVEWRDTFPKGDREAIGTGLDGVKHFTDLAEGFKWADVIVCPDTHSASWVKLARMLNKPVFGAGESEELEQNRSFLKKLQKNLGMPVPPHVQLKGTEELEKFLRSNKDRYIKLDGKYRGVIETFHHADWPTTRDQSWGPMLEGLGANSQDPVFIVEEPIESQVEVGYDGILSNGQYCDTPQWGFEAKDAGYLGCFSPLPKCIKESNEALLPQFEEWETSSMYSTELRIAKDGKAYLIDPTLRFPHPVGATQWEMYANLCDYIVAAAQGRNIPIKTSEKYAASLVIKSSANTGWLEVTFPKKLRHLVKLQNCKCRDGRFWVIPNTDWAAMAVGLGDTPEEAIETCEKVAGEIKCNGKYVDYAALKKVLEETVPAAKKCGIEF